MYLNFHFFTIYSFIYINLLLTLGLSKRLFLLHFEKLYYSLMKFYLLSHLTSLLWFCWKMFPKEKLYPLLIEILSTPIHEKKDLLLLINLFNILTTEDLFILEDSYVKKCEKFSKFTFQSNFNFILSVHCCWLLSVRKKI